MKNYEDKRDLDRVFNILQIQMALDNLTNEQLHTLTTIIKKFYIEAKNKIQK